MAQKRLDHAQIRPALEQVRGEGVTQRVWRHALGRHAGGAGKFLHDQEEPLSREVPRPGARGKETGRVRLPALGAPRRRRVAQREPAGERVARGRRERNHAFPPALAAHQQHPRVPARRGDGQCHKLAHPHARGVEKLHQAGVAGAFRRVATGGIGGREHPVDLVMRQRLGQAARPGRSIEAQRGIVAAPAFLVDEAKKLPDGRKPAGAGRGGKPLGLTGNEVGLDVGLLRTGRVGAPPRQPPGEIPQVAVVGAKRVRGGAPLRRLRVEKRRDPAPVALGGGGARHRAGASSMACNAACRAVSSRPTARNVASASARSGRSPAIPAE